MSIHPTVIIDDESLFVFENNGKGHFGAGSDDGSRGHLLG